METYKSIEEFENYEISNFGTVRNIKTKRILKASINRGYFRIGLMQNDKQKFMFIHNLVGLSFIPNPDNKALIDHIDRNPLNNSVQNLRWCTHSENQRNRCLMKNNKSSIRGVRHYSKNKWLAEIAVDCKRIHLGYYTHFDDAKNARFLAENKYFGDFKPL